MAPYNAGCIDEYRYRVRAHDPEEISLRSSKTQTALKPSLILKPWVYRSYPTRARYFHPLNFQTSRDFTFFNEFTLGNLLFIEYKCPIEQAL